jgi:hypothetical protein
MRIINAWLYFFNESFHFIPHSKRYFDSCKIFVKQDLRSSFHPPMPHTTSLNYAQFCYIFQNQGFLNETTNAIDLLKIRPD